MNIDRKALKGFVDEIEASRTRAKGETTHQSEIFKAAKKKGVDTQALRKVLQRRAMTEGDRDNLDHLIDTYEIALGAKREAAEAMEGGMSAREAAETFDLPRAAVTTLRHACDVGSKNTIIEPPHDPQTGEISQSTQAANAGGDDDAGPVMDPVPEVARVAPPVPAISDEQALAAMDDAFHRLQAAKRAKGLAA